MEAEKRSPIANRPFLRKLHAMETVAACQKRRLTPLRRSVSSVGKKVSRWPRISSDSEGHGVRTTDGVWEVDAADRNDKDRHGEDNSEDGRRSGDEKEGWGLFMAIWEEDDDMS